MSYVTVALLLLLCAALSKVALATFLSTAALLQSYSMFISCNECS
jgi:hypothetical protein